MLRCIVQKITEKMVTDLLTNKNVPIYIYKQRPLLSITLLWIRRKQKEFLFKEIALLFMRGEYDQDPPVVGSE